jgi:hypothetical protein
VAEPSVDGSAGMVRVSQHEGVRGREHDEGAGMRVRGCGEAASIMWARMWQECKEWSVTIYITQAHLLLMLWLPPNPVRVGQEVGGRVGSERHGRAGRAQVRERRVVVRVSECRLGCRCENGCPCLVRAKQKEVRKR